MGKTKRFARVGAMAAGAVAMLLAAQQGGAIAKVVKGAPPKPVSTQRFAVDMWWNVGGDMGGLQKATEACVKRLGDHERPVRISPPPSTTILSKPMLDCLEGEGWRPAGEPRPV